MNAVKSLASVVLKSCQPYFAHINLCTLTLFHPQNLIVPIMLLKDVQCINLNFCTVQVFESQVTCSDQYLSGCHRQVCSSTFILISRSEQLTMLKVMFLFAKVSKIFIFLFLYMSILLMCDKLDTSFEKMDPILSLTLQLVVFSVNHTLSRQGFIYIS